MRKAILCVALAAGAVWAAEMPRLERRDGRYNLMVDGRPYLILGAQVHNSDGWPQTMAKNWATLREMHCNTAEVPVYWEEMEPQEGSFNFATVDGIVEGARANGFRLVLLWFGTWKNGKMDYAPAWVKENPARFPRMLDETGRPVRVLSPHSENNLNADARAFSALMTHLREIDGERHTVIMVQVENEAGSLGTDRDYSPAANRGFEGEPPQLVLNSLHKKGSGSWSSIFGADAPEVFAAYHVAQYIGQVAAAGKKAYPLPMYVNVWPREQAGFIRPGETHPSGGAVSNLLDLWKAAAPAIDVIAPDIYDANAVPFRTLCERYKRADNPLLVPETGGSAAHARHMFYVFGSYDGLGISVFGVGGPGGSDRWQDVTANYGLIAPAIPEIVKLRESGKLRVAVEEEGIANGLVSFDDFDAVARFGPVRSSYSGDNGTGNQRVNGRVLIGEIAPGEFLILGSGANVVFRPKLGAARSTAQLVRVEEGVFENGTWKRLRLLNGDETYFGLNLRAEGTTLRVKLTTY
jgi:hypothetical protein